MIESTSNSLSDPSPHHAVPAGTGASFLRELRTLPVALPLAIATGLLLALAWPMLTWWRWEYGKPESYYAYGYVVPVFVGLMLWHRREEFKLSLVRTQPVGLVVALVGVTLLVFAAKQDMQALMSTGFLTSLVGAVWFLVGTRAFRTIAVPIGFLATMAPLPGPLLNDATLGAQRISTSAAYACLKLIGLANERVGNMIHMDGFTLNVDIPCSGFKLFLTLLVLSGVFAFLTDASPAKKLFLFFLSVPLSIFVNMIRISLVGIVGVSVGATAAAKFHDWSGYISIVLCMVILFGTAKVLGCRKLAGQPLF